MLEVNNRYLKHDYFTDIITFDYSDKSHHIISGEVYISIEMVKSNAEKFKVTFEEELHRVMIHGVLHLCGYKDKKTAEKKVMKQKENKYLRLLSRVLNRS